MALPHEAAEAEDMLRDDTQLLQVRPWPQSLDRCETDTV